MQSLPNDEKKLQASGSNDNLQALNNYEQIAWQVMDSAGLGFAQLEPEGFFSFASPAFSALYSYLPEEMVGQYWKNILPAKEHPTFIQALENASPGYTITIQTSGIKKDGSIAHLEMTLVDCSDDSSVKKYCLAKQLQQVSLPPTIDFPLSTRADVVLESIPDGFVLIDTENRIQYANHEAERFLNKNRNEFTGSIAWEVFPEMEELNLFGPQAILSDDRKHVHLEKFWHQCNSWLSIHVYSTDQGVSIYFRDITEYKQMEANFQKLNESLEQKVQHLASSNDELERFAYVASHDLQEPLRMISSFMQLLQKEYSQQLDPAANQYIHFAIDGAERMKRLISDLLEYSRVGSNREPYTNVDINEVLQEQLKIFEPLIAQNEATIQIDQLPTVKGNKTQLGQLFQNLISNGLKYRSQDAPIIRITVRGEGKHWVLSVADNGIGINAKFFDKIFLIFQRLHGVGKYPGSGIGLTICKKIVEQHGGRIWLESEPGQGSTFYIALPKTT